jgi:hypothetical protein
LLNEQFPGTPVLAVSAKTGIGFDPYATFLDQDGAFGQKILEIDYDIYAEGEAELGWLNCSIHLDGSKGTFEMDAIVRDTLEGIAQSLERLDGEAAHVKVIGLDSGGGFAVANLVGRGMKVDLSLASNSVAGEMDLIVNARAAIDPDALQSEVEKAVHAICERYGTKATFRQTQSLRPGRPTPTHRYSSL